MLKTKPHIIIYILSLKWLFLGAVWFYRKCISPFLPSVCKYTPSCSVYMIQAIKKKGIFVGTAQGLFRLIRCNPFSKGGFDPVGPKRRHIKWTF